jgi:hypothetical protein
MDVMTYEGFQGFLEDQEDEHALQMDGFDDCVVGAGEIGGAWVLVYDYDLLIEKLMGMGMEYGEAVEFHDFNQTGYLGTGTPMILHVKIEGK